MCACVCLGEYWFCLGDAQSAFTQERWSRRVTQDSDRKLVFSSKPFNKTDLAFLLVCCRPGHDNMYKENLILKFSLFFSSSTYTFMCAGVGFKCLACTKGIFFSLCSSFSSCSSSSPFSPLYALLFLNLLHLLF